MAERLLEREVIFKEDLVDLLGQRQWESKTLDAVPEATAAEPENESPEESAVLPEDQDEDAKSSNPADQTSGDDAADTGQAPAGDENAA